MQIRVNMRKETEGMGKRRKENRFESAPTRIKKDEHKNNTNINNNNFKGGKLLVVWQGL